MTKIPFALVSMLALAGCAPGGGDGTGGAGSGGRGRRPEHGHRRCRRARPGWLRGDRRRRDDRRGR